MLVVSFKLRLLPGKNYSISYHARVDLNKRLRGTATPGKMVAFSLAHQVIIKHGDEYWF